jgi:hypothetical protein
MRHQQIEVSSAASGGDDRLPDPGGHPPARPQTLGAWLNRHGIRIDAAERSAPGLKA